MEIKMISLNQYLLMIEDKALVFGDVVVRKDRGEGIIPPVIVTIPSDTVNAY